MKYPSTKKIVDYIVDSYRKAGRTLAKAARRNDSESDTWLQPSSFDTTADAIESAYEKGDFEDVKDESQLKSLFDKYGDTDIYHLVASYFNSTGKILNLQFA